MCLTRTFSLRIRSQKRDIFTKNSQFVKSTEADIVNEREYEFNTVDDSIFTEPDISQYTLKENE